MIMKKIAIIISLFFLLVSCTDDVNNIEKKICKFVIEENSRFYLYDKFRTPIDTLVTDSEISLYCNVFFDSEQNMYKCVADGLDLHFKNNINLNNLIIYYKNDEVESIYSSSSEYYFFGETIDVSYSDGYNLDFSLEGRTQKYGFGFSNSITSISIDALISITIL